MMTYYADVLPSGRVRACLGYEQPETGPPQPLWEGQAEGQVIQLTGPIDWASTSETAVLHWIDGGFAWVETATLDDLKAAAIARTYPDVDKVHFDAVGNRATEYQEAERAARAFADAGYEGEAEDEVHGFALNNPTGQAQTDRWAADRIISQADAFRTAQRMMRSVRFQRQAEMRSATTPEELNAIVAAWSGFIAGLRVQLGLDPQPQEEA